MESGSSRKAQTDEVDAIGSGDVITVDLTREQGGEIEVTKVQSARGGLRPGGTRHVKGDARKLSRLQFSLRRTLQRLIHSPSFRASEKQIVFRNPGGTLLEGPVCQVAKEFSKITPEDAERRYRAYWGPIADAVRAKDGHLWLNSSGDRRAASVVVFDDIAAEFLSMYAVDDLEELAGAHVLAVASCKISRRRKPTVWCGSTNNIVVRRYRGGDVGRAQG